MRLGLLAGIALLAASLWPRRGSTSEPNMMTARQPNLEDYIPGAPHFQWKEFKSRHYPFSVEAIRNIPRVAAALEVLRAKLGGHPVDVISGYRHPEHNDDVDGAPESRHLTGEAADIRVRGVAPLRVYTVANELQRRGQIPAGGLGIYDTFTHADVRGELARWDERTS